MIFDLFLRIYAGQTHTFLITDNQHFIFFGKVNFKIDKKLII